MTVLNLVLHSDNNKIGSSRVIERFYGGFLKNGQPGWVMVCPN